MFYSHFFHKNQSDPDPTNLFGSRIQIRNTGCQVQQVRVQPPPTKNAEKYVKDIPCVAKLLTYAVTQVVEVLRGSCAMTSTI